MVRVRRDYCQGMCRELGLSRWDPQVTSHSCCCGGVAEKIHKLKRRTIQLVFKFFCVSANHLYTQLGNSVFMGRMSLLVIILVLFLFVFLFISLYFSSSKKKICLCVCSYHYPRELRWFSSASLEVGVRMVRCVKADKMYFVNTLFTTAHAFLGRMINM